MPPSQFIVCKHMLTTITPKKTHQDPWRQSLAGGGGAGGYGGQFQIFRMGSYRAFFAPPPPPSTRWLEVGYYSVQWFRSAKKLAGRTIDVTVQPPLEVFSIDEAEQEQNRMERIPEYGTNITCCRDFPF